MINKGIQELLNNPVPVPAPKENPADFKLSDRVDDIGLAVESPSYIKRNCKLCYGRGVVRTVVLDGTVGKVFDGTEDVKNPNRKMRACNCVQAKYTRIRTRVQIAAQLLIKKGTPEKEAIAQALKEI